ncbi:serine/threonine-protein kinase Nek2-like [Thalassophryne amazonica]|uniref:serine/threonine-protein kinase Nek2-like n=1 Tax=Thalassophryne amazonica TaxID=390379 RepID=UPI001471AE22|nr:serine/threonine-protein kinase Nek2-like [Thalassophryne amazonica]
MSFIKDFEVLATVGSGAFGKCQKIRRKSDRKILAWKVVSTQKMSEFEEEMLIQEINLLRELQHPNIVKCYDHFIDHQNKTVYIVMEYCVGGSLDSVIKDCTKQKSFLSEEYILRVLVQLTSALKLCHRRPDGSIVLHQDLKPANVFLDKDFSVKLGDFGLAHILPSRNDYIKAYDGTVKYMCPEKLNETFYHEKSDIWSLGCLIYELCAKRLPFNAPSGKLQDCVNRGAFKRIPAQYSDQLNALIRDMLQVVDFLRPSAEDILSSRLLADHRAGDLDQLLHPSTSAAGLKPRDQQEATPNKWKRRLDTEDHQASKRRREGLCDFS